MCFVCGTWVTRESWKWSVLHLFVPLLFCCVPNQFTSSLEPEPEQNIVYQPFRDFPCLVYKFNCSSKQQRLPKRVHTYIYYIHTYVLTIYLYTKRIHIYIYFIHEELMYCTLCIHIINKHWTSKFRLSTVQPFSFSPCKGYPRDPIVLSKDEWGVITSKAQCI